MKTYLENYRFIIFFRIYIFDSFSGGTLRKRIPASFKPINKRSCLLLTPERRKRRGKFSFHRLITALSNHVVADLLSVFGDGMAGGR